MLILDALVSCLRDEAITRIRYGQAIGPLALYRGAALISHIKSRIHIQTATTAPNGSARLLAYTRDTKHLAKSHEYLLDAVVRLILLFRT